MATIKTSGNGGRPRNLLTIIGIAVIVLIAAFVARCSVRNNKTLADLPRREESNETIEIVYQFRTEGDLKDHFEKHGEEFTYTTAEEYLEGANRVIASPDALTKTEAEDGDLIYYLEDTNEIVFLSTDGYIRTYFKPSSGLKYYEKQ